jgi:hypothetical protein
VIIILSVCLALSWVEQEVTRDQLENHARETPQICSLVVVNAEHHFWSTILPSLNPVGELVVCPATIAQVTNFEFHVLANQWASFMHATFLHEESLVQVLFLTQTLVLLFSKREVHLNFSGEISVHAVSPPAL